MQFFAKKVSVSGIKANVTFVVHQGNEVVLTMAGGRIDQLSVNQSGEELIVTGKSQGGVSMSTQGGQFTTNITGSVVGAMSFGPGAKAVGSVVVGGAVASSMGDIEIKVPKGTEITLDKIDGKVIIGDVEGKITATFDDDLHTIGKMRGGLVNALGESYVTINDLGGDAMLVVNGEGQIVVESGEIDKLTVDAKKNGQLTCRAKCTRATVAAYDSSRVRLRGEVKNEPKVSKFGSARVDISNWQQ